MSTQYLIILADKLDKLGYHEASNALDSLLKYAANRGDTMPRFKEYITIQRAMDVIQNKLYPLRKRLYSEISRSGPDEDLIRNKIERLESKYRELIDRYRESADNWNNANEPEVIYREHRPPPYDRGSEVDRFNDQIRAEEIADQQEDSASDNRSDSMPAFKRYMTKSRAKRLAADKKRSLMGGERSYDPPFDNPDYVEYMAERGDEPIPVYHHSELGRLPE